MIKVLHFRRSDKREVYYMSDSHFGHDRNFIWGKRGFNNKNEHDDAIISDINERARPDDVIIHHGDFCLNTSEEQFENYIARINCQNIYILFGNHNSPLERIYNRAVSKTYGIDGVEVYPFRYKNLIFVGNYLQSITDGRLAISCHYPIQEFDHMKHGAWMLCGHSHYGNPLTQKSNRHGKYLDLGWEGHGKILSFPEVREIMEKKEIVRVSHH